MFTRLLDEAVADVDAEGVLADYAEALAHRFKRQWRFQDGQ